VVARDRQGTATTLDGLPEHRLLEHGLRTCVECFEPDLRTFRPGRNQSPGGGFETAMQLAILVAALDDDRHERSRAHIAAQRQVIGDAVHPQLSGEIRRIERHIESTAHAPIFALHYTVDNGGRREYSPGLRPDRRVPTAMAGPWVG